MDRKIVEKDKINVQGRWIETTFDEAMNGKITKVIKSFIKDKKEGTPFVGIAVHHRKDGFKYFIGSYDENGSLTLPEGPYLLVSNFEDAYETYASLMHENLPVRALFGSSIENDEIPVKIDKYWVLDHDFICKEIEVPLI